MFRLTPAALLLALLLSLSVTMVTCQEDPDGDDAGEEGEGGDDDSGGDDDDADDDDTGDDGDEDDGDTDEDEDEVNLFNCFFFEN